MTDDNRGRVPQMPAGWYDDPTRIGDARYWDGIGWTTSINTDGVTSTAAIEPALVAVPPVQGSQFRARQRPAPAAAPVTMTQSSQRSPLGAVLGAVVAIVLVVAVVFLLTRDDGGGDDPPSSDVPGTESPVTDPPLTEPPLTVPPVSGG